MSRNGCIGGAEPGDIATSTVTVRNIVDVAKNLAVPLLA